MTELDEQQLQVVQREALAWLARIGLGEANQDDLAALRRWRDLSPAQAAASYPDVSRFVAGDPFREVVPGRADSKSSHVRDAPKAEVSKAPRLLEAQHAQQNFEPFRLALACG